MSRTDCPHGQGLFPCTLLCKPSTHRQPGLGSTIQRVQAVHKISSQRFCGFPLLGGKAGARGKALRTPDMSPWHVMLPEGKVAEELKTAVQ